MISMKKAIVNGQEISGEAVQFELDRLVRFYMGHGMTLPEVKKNLPKLEEKALEQAIGAKLLQDLVSTHIDFQFAFCHGVTSFRFFALS